MTVLTELSEPSLNLKVLYKHKYSFASELVTKLMNSAQLFNVIGATLENEDFKLTVVGTTISASEPVYEAIRAVPCELSVFSVITSKV